MEATATPTPFRKLRGRISDHILNGHFIILFFKWFVERLLILWILCLEVFMSPFGIFARTIVFEWRWNKSIIRTRGVKYLPEIISLFVMPRWFYLMVTISFLLVFWNIDFKHFLKNILIGPLFLHFIFLDARTFIRRMIIWFLDIHSNRWYYKLIIKYTIELYICNDIIYYMMS